ncbi:NAD(P)-binding protein [Choiromyces venosus 120613-1]|uniref:NAD(P)-binding protein n=1 Tax=Choiromyces venosus 120613-1 TaxID=1336337 RepID=A0A3N4JGG3_9PEZI|nr:NAD(P)-binding protein [Choiromyces venosus 120613-1]
MTSLFSSSWSLSKIPDLTSKIFLITGGTSGIGFGVVAQMLERNPAKLILLSETEEHGELAKEELQKYGDVSRVEYVRCDFRNLKEVDSTAKGLKEKEKRIDGLVANAGIGVGVYNESADGIDTHFQINHLAQMHLILTLLPNIIATSKETRDARIVLQSSDLHKLSPNVNFASLEEINKDIGPAYLYNRSKLAQILFVRRLAAMLQTDPNATDVFVNATHPGAVSTPQQDQAEEAYGVAGKIAVAATRPFMKDPVTEGCLPALYAATSPEIKEQRITGQYIVPPGKVTDPSEQAQDIHLANNLWPLSEKLLREKLP